ncbi:hypothetical protein BGZ63DRAFT_366069, partial [Mariannaea sp. PMI_226]
LTCTQCGRSFSRPSHLRRHNVIHIPQSQRRTITCEKCGSTFSRRDVLFRHMKVAHALEYVPPTNQQRSCNRCVRRKLKCDRQVPCSACVKSKTAGPCEYPTIEELYDPGFQPGFQISDKESDVGASDPSMSEASKGKDPFDLSTSCSKSSTNAISMNANSRPGNAVETPVGTVQNSSFNTGFQYDFRFSGFDWLDLDVPDIELTTDHLIPESDIPASAVHSNQPSQTQSSSKPTIQISASGLPWPFEQGQEPTSTRCYLPPLRELLHGSLQMCTTNRTVALEGLIKILSEQRLPTFEDATEPTILMGVDLLKKLLDAYFGNFQLIQPIFHPPTWNMNDCPTMLLAAMACLGAVLSDEPNAAELSSSISDVCNPIISWMGIELNHNMPTNKDALDTEWRTWASRERDIRIAWASFEYDCSLCTLTSRRGAVDVSELPSKLPCMDALWEAPSAYAWAALKSRIPKTSLGVPVSSVISAAIAGSPIPENISTWGKRLSGQVIGRLLWDLKQLELVSTTEYFGLSSLSTGQRQSKSSLLAALDRLLETMNNYASTADLVSYNISSLLCHYSHLYTADDIMDMILYVVRSVVSRGAGHDQGVDMARRRLVSALGNDLRRARTLAWHAGQIVAVANEYLVSAPCEIMRLFMSYIFIVAYAQHLPRCSDPSLNPIKIRLDVASHLPEQKQAVKDWIMYGGPARIGSADDILADGAVKTIIQDAQAMLQRLRSWGLAEKFAKILQSFGNLSS